MSTVPDGSAIGCCGSPNITWQSAALYPRASLHEIVNDAADLLRIDETFARIVRKPLRTVYERFVHANSGRTGAFSPADAGSTAPCDQAERDDTERGRFDSRVSPFVVRRRLSAQVVRNLHHFVGCLDRLGVNFVTPLGDDHIDHFFRQIDVRAFQNPCYPRCRSR